MSKLLSLKLSNFRSFFSEQALNLENEIDSNITVIYGPNASGKSNTARALDFMKWFIFNSVRAEVVTIPFEPFALLANNSNPTSLQVEFKNKSRIFRYSFAFTASEIVKEELVELTSQKEKVIFSRDHQAITNIATSKKMGYSENLMNKTRPTSLLITKAREDNNEYANEVFDFFSNFNIITCGTSILRNISVDLQKNDPSMKDKVLSFLRSADFWIRDIKIDEIDTPDEFVNNLPFVEEIKKNIRGSKSFSIHTTHSVRDTEGKIVGLAQFSLDDQESAGTKVIFDLAALIIYSIEHESSLYIDEFGLHLHSDICQYILAKFKKHHEAQLILNTHDVLLMDNLKREEIVFINKRQNEESVVVPFMSLSPRENEPFSKRYKQGLYGAKPIISEAGL